MGQITNPPGGSSGPSTITSYEKWAGAAVLAPAVLPAGTTNNWFPAGLGTARLIKVLTNAAGSSLSGIIMQLGHVLTLLNSGAGDLTLLNQNGGSAVGNRFKLPGDFILPANMSLTIFGDTFWLAVQ